MYFEGANESGGRQFRNSLDLQPFLGEWAEKHDENKIKNTTN